jgi:hypothetical protein
MRREYQVFSLLVAFSKYGRIKLGKDYERTQYSYFGWFSMFFAAAMGTGLISSLSRVCMDEILDAILLDLVDIMVAVFASAGLRFICSPTKA